jgi:hypothetical protein
MVGLMEQWRSQRAITILVAPVVSPSPVFVGSMHNLSMQRTFDSERLLLRPKPLESNAADFERYPLLGTVVLDHTYV